MACNRLYNGLNITLLVVLPFFANVAKAAPVELDEIVVAGNRGQSDSLRPAGKGPVPGYVATESVTGTKTATPLLETPQSIAVVGAKEISTIGAQTVDQALAYVSGVRGDTFGNDPRNDWFLIRGFPGQVSGYFLDGLQLYSNAFATFKVEPWGLERLEVLKGPASVLYGGSNVGGIINAVSKRPPPTAQGTIETGINTFGNKYVAFDIGGPVSQKADNQFYYRLEGLARGGGTQTDFTSDNHLFIAPSLTWAPDGDTRFTVLGSYTNQRTNGQNFLPYIGTVTRAPFGKIPTSLFTSEPGYDTFQRNQALIGYEFEHRFNETFSVRQNVRYSNLRINYQTLYGGGYVNADPNAAELQRFNFVTTPLVSQIAVDNQLEGRFRTGPISHVVLGGLDYKHYTLSDSQGFVVGAPLDLLRPVYTGAMTPSPNFVLNNQVQDQMGVYVQEQAKLGRLTLVLSGRHDSLQSRFDNKLIAPATRMDSTDGAFTGRAGLIYNTEANIAPYATVATSFDPQLGTNTSTGKPLIPTTGILKELGIKYEPIPGRLSLNGALFDLTQNNVLSTLGGMTSVQIGQQQSRGFELQAQGNVTPGLAVLASYTGYRLRTTQDGDPTLIGKVPVNVPQNFGSMLLDYTIQSGSFSGLGFGAGPRYVGGSYASLDNKFGVPGYVVGDALVHFERGHWRASVNVSNITDRTYVASCSSFNACFYGLRRTALFRLAYSW